MSSSFNSLPDATNIQATDLIAISRAPHSGNTSLKATPVYLTTYLNSNLQLAGTSQVTTLDTQLAAKLALAGGTMTGNLILNADASQALQAVTYQQLNALVAGFKYKGACKVATTAALTVTYNNGTSGVGATLTNAGAQTALVIDGVTLAVNDVVLVKDQATQLQNGIYTVTNVGSGSTNWVLTRATNYDQSTEISAGDYVNITSGTTNTQTLWQQTTSGTITIGTTSIVFSLLAVVNVQAPLQINAPNTIVLNQSGITITESQVTNLVVDLANLNTNKQNHNAHLDSLSGITGGSLGLVIMTNDLGTAWATRSLTSSDNSLTITNPDGTAGNPNFVVDQTKIFTSYVATSLSANVDLTNTTNFPVCPTFISVSFTSGINKIILPATNASNAAKKGKPIIIKNTGVTGHEFSIVAQDGTTVILSSVAANSYILLELTDTGTTNGTWDTKSFNSMSSQDASSVFISGGSINGTTIGNSVAADATVNNLTVNTQLLFAGTNETALNVYEEYNHSTTFTWGSFTTPAQTIKITRMGRTVRIDFPHMGNFTSTQTAFLQSVTALPARFIPSAIVSSLGSVSTDNGTTQTNARFASDTGGILYVTSQTGSTFASTGQILAEGHSIFFSN